MSPEFIHFRKSSSASDVWSYGVLMWEVFTCCDPPYGDMNPVDILTMIEKGQRMPMPNTLQDPDIYQNLTLKCWEYNEQDRPNFSAIVQDLSNRISTNPTSTPIRDLGALSQEN